MELSGAMHLGHIAFGQTDQYLEFFHVTWMC